MTDWLILCTHNGNDSAYVVGGDSTRVTATSTMTSTLGDNYYNAYFGINGGKGAAARIARLKIRTLRWRKS